MQYKPPDPGGHIEKRSDIQTLEIIAGKKKPPVKGAKFILVGVVMLRCNGSEYRCAGGTSCIPYP